MTETTADQREDQSWRERRGGGGQERRGERKEKRRGERDVKEERKIQTTESPWRGARERESDFHSALFITNPLPVERRRAEQKNRSKTNRQL